MQIFFLYILNCNFLPCFKIFSFFNYPKWALAYHFIHGVKVVYIHLSHSCLKCLIPWMLLLLSFKEKEPEFRWRDYEFQLIELLLFYFIINRFQFFNEWSLEGVHKFVLWLVLVTVTVKFTCNNHTFVFLVFPWVCLKVNISGKLYVTFFLWYSIVWKDLICSIFIGTILFLIFVFVFLLFLVRMIEVKMLFWTLDLFLKCIFLGWWDWVLWWLRKFWASFWNRF